MRIPLSMIVLVGAVAVSGCAQKGLRDLRKSGPGPDEFLVLPSKPLSEPSDYSSLPAPTPGGSNITDQNPLADAVAVLGGKPSAMVPSQGVPSADLALVSASSRYGVNPAVRQELADEDAKFLNRQRRLTGLKLFPVDRYEQIYARQTLDPYKANEQFRRAGIATPSAPPPNGE